MNLFYEKFKEVLQTLIPVVLLVVILSFTILDVQSDLFIRFLVGAFLLLVGLSIFLAGVDLAFTPIGEEFSREIGTSKSIIKVLVLAFLLGFLITVAEPDLLVLGNQVEAASGGSLGSSTIVSWVSVGVGIMISLGVYHLLKNRKLNIFMAVVYAVIFFLSIFVAEEFLAIAFDASGATTGALTTPFILALSLGLARIKGGKSTEEDSFGLVGVMSSGPILAVMMLSILTGQENIQGVAGDYVFQTGVLGPIIEMLPHIFLESLVALVPIGALFFIYNFVKFKLSKEEIIRIIIGLVYTLLGLTIFLTGVNSGFMDMGRLIGMQLADMGSWVLIGVAFVLGLIVVLVEPAVHVLGEQIEEVTGGHIPINVIKTTLSIGVGFAVALSMVRIVVPEVKLIYFLLPGFLIAIILSFRVDPIFVGIAYDAGGVASGPMTATFVLAFAQGAAEMIPTANVLVDGFGVIAMVAMTPVLSIMILGTIFKRREVIQARQAQESEDEITMIEEESVTFDALMVIVNRHYADNVVEIARQCGAEGATIMHGRGSDVHHQVTVPLLNIEVQPEKEVILFVVSSNKTDQVAKHLLSDTILDTEGEIQIYFSPAQPMQETFQLPDNGNDTK